MEINDGEMLVQLRGDLSGLRSSLNEANSLLKGFQQTVSGLEKTIEGQTSGISTGFSNMTRGLSDSVATVTASTKRIEQSLSSLVDSFEKSSMGVGTSISSMQGSIKGIPTTLESVVYSVRNNTGNMTKQFNAMRDSVTRDVNSMITSIERLNSSQKGSLGAKVSAVGSNVTKASNAQIKMLGEVLSAIRVQTVSLDQSLALLGDNMSASFSKGTKSTKELQAELKRAEKHVNSLGHSLKQLAINTYIIHSFGQFIGSTFASLLGPGVEFSAQIENAKLGMAGILTSMTTINGEDMKFNQAMQVSDALMKRIADNALLTSVTTGELLEVFQALLAPGLSAKMNLEQIVEIATTGANAVKAIGLPKNQIVQEMRDLIMGGIRPASSTLAASLNITDADVKRWREAGTLYTELKNRMEGFRIASKETQETLNGLWSNIKDGIQRTQAEAFQPFTNYIKKELKEIQAMFYTVSNKKVMQKNSKGEMEETEVPYATLNTKTQATFAKLAEIVLRFYNTVKNVFVALAPMLDPLLNVFLQITTLLSNATDLLLPFATFIGGVLASAIQKLADILAFVNKHLEVFLGVAILIATTLAVQWVAGLTTVSTLLAVVRLQMISFGVIGGILKVINAQFLGLIRYVGTLIATMGVALIKFALIAAAILAVVAVVFSLSVAFEETKRVGVAVLEVLASEVDYMLESMKAGLAEYALFVGNVLKAVKSEIANSGLGKFFKMDEKSEVAEGIISKATTYRDNAEAGKAIASTRIDEAKAALSESADMLGKKLVGSIKQFYEEAKKLVPDSDIPSGIEGKTSDSDGKKGKKDKSEERAADAERKANVEKLKQMLKELDYAYQEHEISLEQYYERTRVIETKIAQVEMDAIQAKLDKAEATGNENDADRYRSDLVTREAKLQETLTELTKKEAKAVQELTKEMKTLNAEHAKNLGNLVEAGKLENENKYDTLIKKYRAESEGIQDLLDNRKDLTDVERSALVARQQLATTTMNNLISDKDMADAKTQYSQLKQNADFMNNELTTAVEQVNLEIQKGNLMDIEGKEQILKLQKEYADKVLKMIPAMREWARAADPTGQLSQGVEQMRISMEKVLATTNEITTSIKNNMESSLTDFFKSAFENVKNLKDAFKSLFSSILSNMQKIVAQQISQNLMKAFGNKLSEKWGGQMSGEKTTPSATTQVSSVATKAATNEMNKLINSTKNLTNSTRGLSGVNLQFKTGLNESNEVVDTTSAITKTVGQVVEAGGVTTRASTMTLAQSFSMLANSAQRAAFALTSLSMKAGGSSSGGSGSGGSSFFASLFGFANGGQIRGSGTDTSDDIPIWASNGEFMIRAAAVKKYGTGFLHAINSGTLPKLQYATGGLVGGSSSTSTVASSQQIKVNLINQTGTQMQAKAEQTFNGVETVMTLWLTGISSNVMQSRDVVRGLATK